MIVKKIFSLIVSNFILIVSILAALVIISSKKNPVDRAIFFDVGQGDASLIQLGGIDILVDGGSGDYVVYKLDERLGMDRNIDIVVLTHPHDDHLSGLLDVVNRYDIGQVWLFPSCYESGLYEEFLSYKLNFVEVFQGDAISIDNYRVEVISPTVDVIKGVDCGDSEAGYYMSKSSNVNNDSVVFSIEKVGFENSSVLFMGDAEEEVEGELLFSDLIGQYSVLKAGHHCSVTSSSRDFIKVVNPEVAVCSVGRDNKFGHPAEETVELFEEIGTEVVYTWDGDYVLYF